MDGQILIFFLLLAVAIYFILSFRLIIALLLAAIIIFWWGQSSGDQGFLPDQIKHWYDKMSGYVVQCQQIGSMLR